VPARAPISGEQRGAVGIDVVSMLATVAAARGYGASRMDARVRSDICAVSALLDVGSRAAVRVGDVLARTHAAAADGAAAAPTAAPSFGSSLVREKPPRDVAAALRAATRTAPPRSSKPLDRPAAVQPRSPPSSPIRTEVVSFSRAVDLKPRGPAAPLPTGAVLAAGGAAQRLPAASQAATQAPAAAHGMRWLAHPSLRN
jgi:hypothetical protein